MKKINILLLIPLLVLFLYGCGASPTNSSKGSVTLSVYFPPQTTAGGPVALISASTTSFNVWVWDNAWNILGMATIQAPVAGGVVNTTIVLNPYTGPGKIEVWGYKSTGQGTSFMLNDINLLPQNNPANVGVVEMGQGVVIPVNTVGNTLLSPDGTTYTINNIFLDTTSVVGVQGAYKLGMSVTSGVAAPVNGYFMSSNNIDQFGSITQQWYITNGFADFDIDVPNATRTAWNRYYFTLNFNNGPNGTPTNTPNIQSKFMGTYMFNLFQQAVPTTGQVPAASGTVILNLVNASWSNNIAPPPNTQVVILSYQQSVSVNSPRTHGLILK